VLLFFVLSSTTAANNDGTSPDHPPPSNLVMKSRAAVANAIPPAFRLNGLHANALQRTEQHHARDRVTFKSMADLCRKDGEAASPVTRLVPFFDRLFALSERTAVMKIPAAFAPRVRGMFAAYPGGTEKLGFLEQQTIATARNVLTEEYSLFNEVRRYRPGYQERLSPEKERQLEEDWMANSGADKCDFCSGDRTAEDVFGRLQGKHCYTASNVAKYEQWHSLLIARQHHPLNATAEQLVDYLETAHKFFDRVHALDPKARFPHMMWDAGARASASQPHQHMQMSITQDSYYTRAEHTRLAALNYYRGWDSYFDYHDDAAAAAAAGGGSEPHHGAGRNYWADVVTVHEALGLAVRYKRSAILSYLTPIKERELIVVTESSASPCFATLIAVAVAAMRDDVGTRAFSLAVLLEAYGKSGKDDNGRRRHAGRQRLIDKVPYPAIARVVDRGSPSDKRSDVGAMEFFGANNVGADPFHIMPFILKRVNALP
jgi:hypothetical protein